MNLASHVAYAERRFRPGRTRDYQLWLDIAQCRIARRIDGDVKKRGRVGRDVGVEHIGGEHVNSVPG